MAPVNKKGIGGEIDWILALGMFLMYLAVVLIFFKPGVRAIVKSDTLLDLVQTSIEKDLTWMIVKQPMFTEPTVFRGQGNVLTNSDALTGNAAVFELIGDCDESRTSACNQNFPITSGFPPNVNVGQRLWFFQVTTSSESANIVNEQSEDQEAREDPNNAGSNSGGSEQGEVAQNEVRETHNRGRSGTGSGANADSGERKLRYRLESISRNPILQLRTGFGTNNPPVAKRKYLIVYSDRDLGRRVGNELPARLNPRQTGSTNKACMISSPAYKCDPADLARRQDYPSNCPPLHASMAECHLKYSLGVPERLEGINIADFVNLNNWACRLDANGNVVNLEKLTTNPTPAQRTGRVIGYPCVKKVFGFPDIKEFKLKLIITNPDGNQIEKNFPITDPPLDSLVEVRQFNTFLLTEEAVRVPATVSILVW